MKMHAQFISDDLRLVDAAGACSVDVDLLESDDVRLTSGDDFRNTCGAKPAVNAEAAVNIICQDPRHLFPQLCSYLPLGPSD
jgi:hypothetical protein